VSSAVIQWLVPGGAEAYNDWRLVWLNEWPVAWWWVVGLAIGLGLLASALGWRRLPARSRVAVAALRTAAALALFAAFLQPGVELRAVSPIRGQIQVVFDASRSMGIAARDGTRAEVVAEHWRSHADVFEDLRAKATIEAYTFGEGTQPADPEALDLEPTQERTQIGRLLRDFAWQAAGRDVRAIVLYSDGADTEGLEPEEAARLAGQVGVPIHTIGFSSKDAAPGPRAPARAHG
jgi:hypothetical protein